MTIILYPYIQMMRRNHWQP